MASELYGLGVPIKDIPRTVVNNGRRMGHLFFSDNTRVGNGGQKLVDVIVKYGLGPVAESAPNRNPQSGNTIIGWVWTPDYPAIERYIAGKISPLPGLIPAKGVSRSRLRARR